MSRNIKEELLKVTGGEFANWYMSLSPKEKETYKKEFEKIKERFYEKRR